MAEHSRYHISKHGVGIANDVLTNKLGITDQKQLDDAETILLADAYEHFFELSMQGKLSIDLSFLFDIHAYFLRPLYVWAGKIRTVDISKENILFAPARNLENALKDFEKLFKKNIPESSDVKRVIAEKLAIIHAGNSTPSIHFVKETVVQFGFSLISSLHMSDIILLIGAKSHKKCIFEPVLME